MKKVSVFLAIILLVLIILPAEKVYAIEPSDKVDALVKAGLVQGYPDGTLGLDRPITRAEISVILTRLKANNIESSGKVIFKDVPKSHWAFDYINRACQIKNSQGIPAIVGYPNGRFKPSKNISYGEILKILVAATKDDLTSDDVKSSSWPVSWILWAGEMGLFGYDAGVDMIYPDETANRQDVFVMIYNAMEDSLTSYVQVKKKDVTQEKSKPTSKDKMVADFNSGKTYDRNLFQQEFLALINADRRNLGLNDLSWDSNLDLGTGIRSEELANYGSIRVNGQSHVRLDGSSWQTALDYMEPFISSVYRGENLVELEMPTILDNVNSLMTDEKYMAKTFYDFWWNSQGHRDNMMNPNYTHLSVQIRAKDDGKSDSPNASSVFFVGTTIFRGN